MDKETASHALKVALDCGARLNEFVATLQSRMERDEYVAYRLAIGRVMGELLLQLINPIVQEHEDLRPAEMQKFDRGT